MKKITKILTLTAATIGAAIIPMTAIVSCGKQPEPVPPGPEPTPTETIVPVECLNITEVGILKGLADGWTWDKVIATYPNVDTVEIPANVFEIKGWALDGMPAQIKTITIDQGEYGNIIPLWIDTDAFKNLKHVTTISLPERLDYVDDYAFDGCESVTTLDISTWSKARFDKANPFDGVGIFGSWPEKGQIKFGDKCGLDAYYFLRTNGLGEMVSTGLPIGWFDFTVGEDITDFDEGHFCVTHIKDTSITGKEEYIVYQVNKDAISSGTLTIPAEITGFAPKALSIINPERSGFPGSEDMTKLTKIDMSQNSQITKIPFAAFFGDKNLKIVELPKSLVCIDSHAFDGCSIEDFNWDDLAMLHHIGGHAFEDSGMKVVNLSNLPVEDIGPKAFAKCSFNTFEWPQNDTLTKIAARAFDHASFTKIEVSLPTSLVYIGMNAFDSSNILHSPITNCQQLIYVGEEAFANTQELDNLTISNSVLFIGDGVLSESNATSIIVDQNNPYYTNDPDNLALFEKDSDGNWIKLLAVAHSNNALDYDIEGLSTVREIGAKAFSRVNWTNLSTDNIDLSGWESLQKIGEYAFNYFLYGDDGYSLTLPKSIKHICSYAFAGCKKLTAIQWEDADAMQMETLDNYFLDDTVLTSFEIPNGIQSFSTNAFASHYGIKLKELILPNTLKTIVSGAYLPSSLNVIDVSKIKDLPSSLWSPEYQHIFAHVAGEGCVVTGNEEPSIIDFWTNFFEHQGLNMNVWHVVAQKPVA